MPRPKNPLLSSTAIANAALQLVEDTGDIQMVQLARHLGVAPSSLYTHVSGRSEVIDLARLQMLKQMTPAEPGQNWQVAVEALLRQLTMLYARHRKILPLIFATTVTDERSISVYEPVFAALLTGGFRAEQLRLVIALVEFQAMGIAQGLPVPAMSAGIRETLPAYTASIVHSRYSQASATDFAVNTIIRGLESTLADDQHHELTQPSRNVMLRPSPPA
ncbi:TetR/AcrR family transcriptional regulator [Paenarthrobacter sp. NPDC090520]|uniref:TetR/AcrR family transcriptional regulator n=1 Tax=Paenarthrobacter sp. NPDC090520 TaxID=3364382 RepID=UPI0037FD0591